jgi:hypothetical protein
MEQRFSMRVLGRHEVAYFFCTDCGFLKTERPHWLDEAYSEAIARADTGLVYRNIFIARRLAPLLLLQFDPNGRFLDFAGGTGLLVRLMRDMGFDFFWHDPYSTNVHARGFEHAADLRHEAVTAFEVLEHVENPVDFVRSALSLAKSDTLIFSTELFEGAPPEPGTWWYYTPETGQHISFFRRGTLERLAQVVGLRLYSSGSLHMLTQRSLNGLAFQFAMSRLSWPLTYPMRRLRRAKTGPDHLALLGNADDARRTRS